MTLPWRLTHPHRPLAAAGRYPRVGHGASQPPRRRLVSPAKGQAPSGAPRSALHRPVIPTTTTSADFCRPVPAPRGAGSTPAEAGAERQISQGKTRDLRSIHLSHLRRHPPDDIGLQVFWPPRPGVVASMRLLFVRPELGVQLPADPASRRRPCCSASPRFLSSRPAEDFHLQVASPPPQRGWTAPVTALRAIPGAPKKKAAPDRAPLLQVLSLNRWQPVPVDPPGV
jgi:hypothetical protein